MEITLEEPAGGVMIFGSAGQMRKRFRYFNKTNGAWGEVPSPEGTVPPLYQIELFLIDGSRRRSYPAISTTQPAGHDAPAPAVLALPAATLADFLTSLPHGTPLAVEMRVSPPPPKSGGTAISGYVQTLRFPLRFGRPGLRRLPLRPAVMQYEDPEYNRRLASSPAQQTGTIADATGSHPVLLAADRREYNTTTPLFVIFIVTGLAGVSRILSLRQITPDGIPLPPLPTFTLVSSSLLTVQLSDFPSLRAGDALEISLIDDATKTVDVVLRVAIVSQPVVPVPEAAYALLRREDDDHDERVHCARFAWSPMPDRIDLLDPSDLAGKIVRRRAVFQWTDSIRPPKAGVAHATHRIQKINFNGSTHFPTWDT